MIQALHGLKRFANPTTVIFAAVLILLLLLHVVVPKIIYEVWTRDGDVGLWFCSGVFIAELSVAGTASRWDLGRYEWRLLGTAYIVLLLVLAAWLAFVWTGPISRPDAIAFLFFVISIPAAFGLFDAVTFGLFSFKFAREKHEASPTGGLTQSDQEPLSDGIRLSFGLASMFGWITWSALTVMLVRSAMLWRFETAYRYVRSYFNLGFAYLTGLILFFWLLHLSLTWSTLGPKIRTGVIVSLGLAIFGTELIRNVQQWWTVSTLDYLNWEFPIIVSGFVVAHLIVGATVRWTGWLLCRV